MNVCKKVLRAERALDEALDNNVVATMIECVAVMGLFWALSTMVSGCSPQPGDNYYDIDVVVEAPVEEGDDDSTDEEEPADDDDSAIAADDDDSAVEEIEEITFRVGFSTAWSASGMLEIAPGEVANLGAFLFDAEGGSIRVLEIELRMMYLDDVQFGSGFMIGGNNSYVDEVIDAHIEWCALNHVFTGSTFAGPVAPQDGILRFPNSFVVPNNENEPEIGEKPYLNVICKFSELEPQSESDAFAIQLFAPELTIPVEGTQGEPVVVDYWSMNGNGQFPMLAAVLVPSMVEPPYATVTKSALQPGPLVFVGWIPTLDVDVCASAGTGDITISNMKFEVIGMDAAGTGWNTCGQLGQEYRFVLYSVTDGWTTVQNDIELTSLYNGLCSVVPTAIFRHASIAMWQTVSAGTCKTYELWVDTSGASIDPGDAFQVNVVDDEWLIWSDESGNGYDGSDLAGSLPIIGDFLYFVP